MIRLNPLFYASLICALIALAPKLYGQEPAPEPVWAHEDEEIILDARLVKDQLTNVWGADLTAAWAHFASDATEIGPIISYAKDTDTGSTGAGVGMLYEYNLPSLRFGHFFLGGDAQYLMADAGDLAPLLAATRAGYKLHVGESAAVRISMELKRPVSPDGDAAKDRLSSLGLALGISFGVKPTTQIQ